MDRYNKYLVIKNSDIASFLNDYQKQTLEHLTNIIQNGRLSKGKAPQSYVCVAADWPMYEQVWSMVESFVDGKPNEIEQLTARVRELETQLAANNPLLDEAANRIDELEAEKKELQALLDFDNARLDQIEDELDDVEYLGPYVEGIKVLKTQLAAAQAYAEQLLEALEKLATIANQYAGHYPYQVATIVDAALSLPADTSALDAYVSEKVKIARDIDEKQIAYLFEERSTLTRQRDLAVEALEAIAGRRIFIDNLASNVDIAVMTLDAIKESEAMAQAEHRE